MLKELLRHTRHSLDPLFAPASVAVIGASATAGKVILFHAVEKTPHAMKGTADLFPEDNPYFEKQVVDVWEKSRLQVCGAVGKHCEVGYEIRHRNAKDQILGMARETKADLIVMGARGLGKSSSAWGSTISEVVRDGRFPVLGVRELAA